MVLLLSSSFWEQSDRENRLSIPHFSECFALPISLKRLSQSLAISAGVFWKPRATNHKVIEFWEFWKVVLIHIFTPLWTYSSLDKHLYLLGWKNLTLGKMWTVVNRIKNTRCQSLKELSEKFSGLRACFSYFSLAALHYFTGCLPPAFKPVCSLKPWTLLTIKINRHPNYLANYIK